MWAPVCAALTLFAATSSVPLCTSPLASVDGQWFCHDLDCPNYTVKKTISNVLELRAYEAGKWVSTTIKGKDYDKAVSVGFMRLFRYISGANVGKEKIPMTAPVRVKILPGDGPFCEDTFTISFFVPFDMQDNPPAATNPDVFVEPAAAASYYVVSWGGRTNIKEILDKATDTVQYLQDNNYKYDFTYFYSAGYDSPFRIFNRHNEAWIPAASHKLE